MTIMSFGSLYGARRADLYLKSILSDPRVEHAMLQLAKSLGMSVATSRIETIGGKDVLMVKRFDREKVPAGCTRARMISGLTVLRAGDAPETRDRWSYVQLAEELRRVVAEPKKDAQELFRRICFNALIANIDDHPRNHALIAKERDWRLSPAFDLTPSAVTAHRIDVILR
jgi:serine/threonine-protein kinase HipA